MLPGANKGKKTQAGGPVADTEVIFMSHRRIYRRTPFLSLHQKQMRFFTGISMFLCTVFVLGIIYLTHTAKRRRFEA